MENAKIAIFEDRAELRELLNINLTAYTTHSVVVEAGSVEEATKVVNELNPGDIDIALVDGKYSPKSKDCSEGAQIVELLRAKFGDLVSIVAISSAHEDEVKAMNADEIKPKYRPDLIRDYIAQLKP